MIRKEKTPDFTNLLSEQEDRTRILVQGLVAILEIEEREITEMVRRSKELAGNRSRRMRSMVVRVAGVEDRTTLMVNLPISKTALIRTRICLKRNSKYQHWMTVRLVRR